MDVVLVEKMLKFNFLPRTPSALQQARRRALLRSFLRRRAAIFGNKMKNGRAAPVGRKEMDYGVDESAPHLLRAEGDRGDLRFHRVGSWNFKGTTTLGVAGFAAAVLTLATALF